MPPSRDPAAKDHLDTLLAEAREQLKKNTLLGDRAAAFLVLDYYQGVLLSCSRRLHYGRWTELIVSVIGHHSKASGDLTHGGLDAVLEKLPSLPHARAERWRGLKKFRNDLAHRLDFAPRRVIESHVKAAEEMKAEIEKATDDTVALLEGLREFPREVLGLVLELDTLAQNWAESYETPEVEKVQEAGHAVAAADRESPTAEDIRTYGQLTAWVAVFAERQALAEEAQAEDAAAEAYAAMMEAD